MYNHIFIYNLFIKSTIFIQREVILRVAKFFWSTGNKNIIVAKEILQAGHLSIKKRHDEEDLNRSIQNYNQ